MLSAFRRVREQRDDVRLRIVLGEPPAHGTPESDALGSYEQAARALGIRHLIDVSRAAIAALPEELASAAIALNPRSACPGIPQKLLNYMAAGRAIVSFSGSAKAIAHGETGWVVPDGDVDAFAAGILRLLEDEPLARRLGENARKEAARAYTWDVVAARLEEVYTATLRR
jgi:glycosyltransferase involved in cell wall biosynthesis